MARAWDFNPTLFFVFPSRSAGGGDMSLRGIRGATTSSANTRDAILDATRELLDALVRANNLRIDDVASIYFTVTPDLDAAFPAAAVRGLGWQEVAALDAQAPRVMNDVPRCIRVLIHWNTEAALQDVRHVYLRGAQALRPDRVSKSNA
jgi:chorismate mutase